MLVFLVSLSPIRTISHYLFIWPCWSISTTINVKITENIWYPDGITNNLLPFCTCCFMKTTFHHINQQLFSGKYWSLSDPQLICLANTCSSNWRFRPFLLHAPAQIFLHKSNMLFYWHSGTHRKLVIKIWDVIMNFKVKAPLTLAGSWQSCYQEYFETKSNGNAVSPRFSCV